MSDDENHTADLGHLTLWAEVLNATVGDIAAGIRIGALSAGLGPTAKEFVGQRAVKAMDALEATQFLKSPGGARLCDMLRCEPDWVLRRCRMRASERKGGANIQPTRRGPVPGISIPRNDVTGRTVKSWTAIRLTGQSTSEGCLWLCRCHLCGLERDYPARRILNGRAGPCPCQSKAAEVRIDAKGCVAGGSCRHCGEAFRKTGGAEKLYCSPKCRQAHGDARRKSEGGREAA